MKWPPRDVYDEIFDHPELTLRQAHWRINWRRIVLRWVRRILFFILIVLFVVWKIWG